MGGKVQKQMEKCQFSLGRCKQLSPQGRAKQEQVARRVPAFHSAFIAVPVEWQETSKIRDEV